MRKEHLKEENCQGDLWQENYLGGWINGTTKNTREDQREIGDNRKEKKQAEEECQKQ